MVADGMNGIGDGLFYRIKSSKPLFKINAAVFHQINGFLTDTPLFHVVDHHVAVDVLDAAVRVTDDHDFFHAKLNDCYQKTADYAAERIGNHSTGIFDDFYIAVF